MIHNNESLFILSEWYADQWSFNNYMCKTQKSKVTSKVFIYKMLNSLDGRARKARKSF
jgi:hypothetical protein